MRLKRVLLLAALTVLVIPAGCIFSPDDGGGEPPPPKVLPFADTPEQLMKNFQTVYEEMDIDGYRQVIDPNFKIYLSQDTITEYALPREFFDYDEEVLIAERMFSGNSLTRPNGTFVPGITRIQFNIFEPEATWETSPADHKIPNALWAPYQVQFVIEQGNVGRLNIEGRINFYLTSQEVEYQGRMQTQWKMVGQEDFTVVPVL